MNVDSDVESSNKEIKLVGFMAGTIQNGSKNLIIGKAYLKKYFNVQILVFI